jgi:hypothetical protein
MALKKEDIALVTQLYYTLKELAEKLEIDIKNKDNVEILKTKKEMLKIQKRIEELI